tara:strand:+ start:1015 stop:1149 length:135 start_codon:yes stop_codon:yes gene_type:complete
MLGLVVHLSFVILGVVWGYTSAGLVGAVAGGLLGFFAGCIRNLM